jgi:uncharacterized membrane protein
MNEREEKLIGQETKDDATMNFVSRQAQEAILDPNLLESYKDEILEAAVGTILSIAEKRNAYNAKRDADNAKRDAYNANRRESRRLKRSRTIYESK